MADHCYTCRWCKGKHDPVCPEIVPANKAEYDKGWVEGRQGRDCPDTATEAFKMGWVNGNSALEEYENGE